MGALNCVGLAKDQALIEAARTEDLHELAKLMVDRGTAVVDEVPGILKCSGVLRTRLDSRVLSSVGHESAYDWSRSRKLSNGVHVSPTRCPY